MTRLIFPVLCLLAVPVSAASVGPEAIIASQVPAARAILDAWRGEDTPQAGRKLHIVYWTPADREPAPRYRERLNAIMMDIRGFYAREMERLGFGPLTIGLDLDGLLRIHLVKGRHPYAHYNNKSGGEIRNESLPVLRADGINPDRETIMIFCNMSNWDPEKKTISQNSPYYAGGTHRNGTAWQVDSPILDLELLDDKKPMVRDGQYGNISVGRYNTIFIGGIAHELGHALGMPHNRETPAGHAAWGTALMGAGNRTYGEERRGEGKGSFLTLAHGLQLAAHPMFCGVVKEIDARPRSGFRDLEIAPAPEGKGFRLSGIVTGTPPVHALVGYMDPEGGGNYDATTCTAVPDAQGRFTLKCDALARSRAAKLRVVVLHANGSASSYVGPGGRLVFPYTVARDGTPDIAAARTGLALEPLIRAIGQRRGADVEAALGVLESRKPDPLLLETARVLAKTVEPSRRTPPSAAPGASISLADAAWKEARVGWGLPVANRLPGPRPLLVSGSRLFARGLYAHAPSRYVYELGGKWNRLTGHVGLANTNPGSVVFRITSDGRELWRSAVVRPGQVIDFDVPVQNVAGLVLETTDAGDGNSSDWALWLDPRLRR